MLITVFGRDLWTSREVARALRDLGRDDLGATLAALMADDAPADWRYLAAHCAGDLYEARRPSRLYEAFLEGTNYTVPNLSSPLDDSRPTDATYRFRSYGAPYLHLVLLPKKESRYRH